MSRVLKALAFLIVCAGVAFSAPGSDDGAATPPGSGIAYYISTSGNDNNDGRSSASPWKTLAKVNAQVKSPGDSFLFKRGDEWRTAETILFASHEGTAAAPIVYGAYGVGPRPRFVGSWGRAPTGQPLQGGFLLIDRLHIVGKGESEPSTLQIHGARNIVIQNSVIERFGNACLEVSHGAQAVDVVNSVIRFCGLLSQGVPQACLSQCGLASGAASGECIAISRYENGIAYPAVNVRVIGNDISYCGDEGIDLRPGASGVVIENNWVHDLLMASSVGAISALNFNRFTASDSASISCNRVFRIHQRLAFQNARCSASEMAACANFVDHRASGLVLSSLANLEVLGNVVEDVENSCFVVQAYAPDTVQTATAKWLNALSGGNTCNRSGDAPIGFK